MTFTGIFIFLISGLLIFSGCAEKKSVVTGDTSPQKEISSVQKSEPAEQAPMDTTVPKDTTHEKSVDLEKRAAAESPVRDINFDFDSFSIRSDAREILKINAGYFMKNRVSSIVVEGHCDERGTAEYNMALGERRAQETKNYLVNLGIKESIIKTVSFGEENPLDPASDENAWAKNRRAHFVVTR